MTNFYVEVRATDKDGSKVSTTASETASAMVTATARQVATLVAAELSNSTLKGEGLVSAQCEGWCQLLKQELAKELQRIKTSSAVSGAINAYASRVLPHEH